MRGHKGEPNTAVKVATFGMVTDQTEMRWCADCDVVTQVPTIPPEDEDGGLDTSVYDCPECDGLMEIYHPEMNHDRCRVCGSYIDEGAEYCDRCEDADGCARDGCDSKAPWGEYCHPRCQERAEESEGQR